jgi:hypothetical protein
MQQCQVNFHSVFGSRLIGLFYFVCKLKIVLMRKFPKTFLYQVKLLSRDPFQVWKYMLKFLKWPKNISTFWLEQSVLLRKKFDEMKKCFEKLLCVRHKFYEINSLQMWNKRYSFYIFTQSKEINLFYSNKKEWEPKIKYFKVTDKWQ